MNFIYVKIEFWEIWPTYHDHRIFPVSVGRPIYQPNKLDRKLIRFFSIGKICQLSGACGVYNGRNDRKQLLSFVFIATFVACTFAHFTRLSSIYFCFIFQKFLFTVAHGPRSACECRDLKGKEPHVLIYFAIFLSSFILNAKTRTFALFAISQWPLVSAGAFDANEIRLISTQLCEMRIMHIWKLHL